GEFRRLFAKRLKPVGNRLGPSEARVVEVVTPAETLRLPVPQPAMEAEGCEIEAMKPRQELFLLCRIDKLLIIAEAQNQRLVEQQAPLPNSSFSCECFSSGASCSNVHCFGSLSGRQRRKPVPCRKRRPVTWS